MPSEPNRAVSTTAKPLNRVITTHVPSASNASPKPEPKATFHPLTGPKPFNNFFPGVGMSVVYASKLSPNMNDDADVEDHKKRLEEGMGLDVPGGVVARVVEWGPAEDEEKGFMHRTPSLDFAAVLSGEGM